MIKVQGYSGCAIRVLRSDCGHHTLEKSTEDPGYVPRLRKQAQKQMYFRERNAISSVFTPAVIYERSSTTRDLTNKDKEPKEVETSMTIGMEFTHHTDAVTFLHKATVKQVEEFGGALLDVVRQYLDWCEMKVVQKEVFTSKLEDVRKNVSRNPNIGSADKASALAVIEKLCTSIPDELSLPVGCCHGDLTLSNILIRGALDGNVGAVGPAAKYDDWLVLIDFLDNFVESPLADIAKLHQDLRFGWTIRLHENSARLDKVKLFMVFSELWRRVEAEFSKHDWYEKGFRLFFAINQLRVLQYCKSESIASHLVHTLAASSQ